MTLPPDHPEALHAVEQVAACVEERYVDAAAGARAAAHLRSRTAAGDHDFVPYGPELAPLLTRDLHTVLPDLRLQVRWSPELLGQVADGDRPLAVHPTAPDLDNHGLSRVERLPGNVGLLVLHHLDEPEEAAAVVDAAFGFLARCSALVLDLRRTTGGTAGGVAHLLGHLLAPGTPLLSVVDRTGATVATSAVPAGGTPTFAPQVPVLVLTGPRTVSACEELAYDLQAFGRATVVGQITAGVANPVDVRTVDPRVVVRVPARRVVHSVTGTSWEGDGVRPDHACPADDALDEAHLLAARGVHARVVAGQVAPAAALVEELDELRALDPTAW